MAPRLHQLDESPWAADAGVTSSDLGERLRLFEAADDETLAMFIRADGRERLASGEKVTLATYLASMPALPERPEPLDAAIDVALRGLSGSSVPTSEAVSALLQRHPDLEAPIRDAAVLAHALQSTTDFADRFAVGAARRLPGDFGPPAASGPLRYRLLEQLGLGAFGEVFLAEDRTLSDTGRPALVAIKVLRTGPRDEFAHRRLSEEAVKARRLDHPNVVRVLDRGVSAAGEEYIVYEHVEGGDLAAWRGAPQRPVGVRTAATIVSKAARAVHAAHGAGLVHCDLKPANILMTRGGEPKVADFGIAIRVGDVRDRPPDESLSAPMGAMAFMSPEQFRMDEGSLSAATDIYALGGLLYWMLTGRLPNGDTREAIASAHAAPDAQRTAHSPARLRAGVDRDLDRICARALAPAAKDRHISAAHFGDDLEAWLRREPIRWTRPSPARIAWLFARRRPVVALLAVCLALAFGGLVIGLEYARRASRVAQAKEIEARIAATTLDNEMRWKAQVRADLSRSLSRLSSETRVGLAAEVLTGLWAAEWLHGPRIVGDPEAVQAIWSQRITVLRGLLDERRAVSGRHSLESLLLEMTIGFWLVKSDDHTEAEPLLAANLAGRRDLLPDGDPWLEDVEAIRLAATANRLIAAGSAGTISADERMEGEAIVPALRSQDARLAAKGDGAQMRLMALERIERLCEPRLLDRADERLWASKTIDSLGLSIRRPKTPEQAASAPK